MKIGFIGAGTVGTTLAIKLNSVEYKVISVFSRSRLSSLNLVQAVNDGVIMCGTAQEAADLADLVFITTPDDVIASICESIIWHPGQFVVHCSGSASTDVLNSAVRDGAIVGCFHPLQTLAGVSQALENLPGSTFAIEAVEPLTGILKNISARLDGNYIILKPGDKTLYHTAAVIASNYMVTLVKMAADLWGTFDIPPELAVKALMPLLKGTLNNIDRMGIPQCLTGPIARGDVVTLKHHLDALSKEAPHLIPVYCELGLKTIPVARAKNKITIEQAEELENVLQSARIISGER